MGCVRGSSIYHMFKLSVNYPATNGFTFNLQLDKALLTGNEEYDDVYDIYECLASQQLVEQEGHLCE